MAFKITEDCVGCSACESMCERDAIKSGDVFVINAEKCTECGDCVTVCPVGAIEQAS